MRETVPEDLQAAYELTDPDRFATYSYPASHTHEFIERIAKAEARNKVLEEALREAVTSLRMMPRHENCDACEKADRAVAKADAALREDR